MRTGTQFLKGLVSREFSMVWIALAALMIAGALVAPASLGVDQVKTLLFFGSLLGIAALGQHLVVTVGGLDLSIGPTIALTGLVFATQCGDTVGSMVIAVAIAAAVGGGVGLLNGISVVVLRITPLIATLAVGSIVLAAAYGYTSGVPIEVPDIAHDLVLKRFLWGYGSVGLVVWLVLLVIMVVVLRYTAPGRRLVGVGSGPAAMNAMGFRISRYRMAAYMAAGAIGGIAGATIGAFAGLPGISIGDPYMILTIAAVVIAGTPLGGGRGSVVATAGGALFMTQLGSTVASLKATTAVQMIVEGCVIAGALALYSVRRRRGLRRRADEADDVASAVEADREPQPTESVQ